MDSKLSKRKVEILYNAVDNYIKNAQPITSGFLHKRYLRNLSSATIRSELNTLEKLGYLKQLHTSSGRVPTDKAYRLFVNKLMSSEKFDIKSLELVSKMFTEKTTGFNEMISAISQTLSEITNYPTVVVVKGFDKLRIQSVNIIPIIGSRALVLISTNSGIVDQSISLNKSYSEDVYIDLSKVLTKHFKDKTISEMVLNIANIEKLLSDQIGEYKGIFNVLSHCLIELSKKTQNRVFSHGSLKLLDNPEYENFKDVEKVVRILEDNETVEGIFENSIENYLPNDVAFRIGEENTDKALKNCAIISTNYKLNGDNIAKIGVIGPKRMDYSKVASVLKYMIGELTTIKQIPISKDRSNNINILNLDDD